MDEQRELNGVFQSASSSRIHNSVANILTGTAAHVVTLILQFVYRTVFIHILGIAYLGVNGLFTNILTVFSLAELGIGQAIIFSLYKPIREGNIASIRALMELFKKTYWGIGLFILLAGTAFLPLLSYIVPDVPEGVEHLHFIFLLFVAETGVSYFFSFRQAYLAACQQQYYLNIYGSVFSICREILRITLILITEEFIPVLIFSCIWTILQNAIFSALIIRKHPYIRSTKGCQLDATEKKEIFRNIRALIIYKVGTLALNSTDNIIISTFVGLIWVGLYSNYQVLVVSVGAFITIIFSSLTASIGHLNAGNDQNKKREMFQVVNMATFWVWSISSVCFLVALTPTVTCWLGEEYTIDSGSVAVIVLNIYIAGMLYTPFNYRQTMGLFIYGKWRPVISAIINIAVSIWLAELWGLKGVLAGTIIARVTTNVWFDPFIVYLKGFHASPLEYFVKYALYLALFLMSCGLGLCIAELKLVGGLVDILLHCVLITVSLNVIYYLLFRKTASFSYLMSAARALIEPRLRKMRHRA